MSDRREQINRLIEEAEREAYARGYNDAIAAVSKAAAALSLPSASPVTELVEALPVVTPQAPVGRNRGRPPKAIGLVRATINAKPGLKGVEIANVLDGAVMERTVRTCLRRLRDTGEIKKRKDAWFPTKSGGSENVDGEAVGSLPH